MHFFKPIERIMNVLNCLYRLRRIFIAVMLVALVHWIIRYGTHDVGIKNTGRYDGHVAATGYDQFQSRGEDKRQVACIQPHLPVWSDEIRRFQKSCTPPSCGSQEDWIYTKQSRFYISEEVEKKVGKIECVYTAIVNVDNYTNRVMETIKSMPNGSILKSDVFKVSCKSSKGFKYNNIHACIAKTEPRSVKVSRTRYNVVIFGFDSVSRNQMKRMLPKTHTYFTKELGGHVLNGYNTIGDGTVSAFVPMLAGRKKPEMLKYMDTRKTKHADDVLDFVWRRFEDQGYITQYGEDWFPNLHTFYFKLEGFRKQPVHHFLRPYILEAAKDKVLGKLCLGKKRSYSVVFDWLKEGILTNQNRPFFTLAFMNEYSHDSNQCFGLLDDPTKDFLSILKTTENYNNTFVFLISDHGMRFGGMRNLEFGKLEERMPYFGIVVPSNFRREFPSKYEHFQENTNRLTTPLDVYKTLLDLLGEKEGIADIKERSYSLFDRITDERTCADADIERHWCACLTWNNVSICDMNVTTAADAVVKHFNTLLTHVKDRCHVLTLSKVVKAVQLVSNKEVLRFKETVDWRYEDMTAKTKTDFLYYQITIETTPGFGLFEVTTSVNIRSGKVSVEADSVSRINRYYDDPACVVDEYPHLAFYCVCKKK